MRMRKACRSITDHMRSPGQKEETMFPKCQTSPLITTNKCVKVLEPSSAAISKVDCMPSASRNFIGKKKKKEKWHWSKGRIPWDLYKKENRWMMEKALAEGWRKRESLPPSLSREEDQRFVLCITMDIRSPILMSPGVWCSFHRLYSLWVHKWSLHGNQWVSFLPCYLTAQASAQLPTI